MEDLKITWLEVAAVAYLGFVVVWSMVDTVLAQQNENKRLKAYDELIKAHEDIKRINENMKNASNQLREVIEKKEVELKIVK